MMGNSGNYLVLNGLLTLGELQSIDALLQQARFEAGQSTATDAAKLVKNNLQLPKAGSFEKQQIDQIVLQAIFQSAAIQQTLMPTRILPPIISKYEPGMHYGMHVDSPIMADPQAGVLRTDVGMTLFLSDPDSYDGGELKILTDNGETSYKLAKGDAIIYPTTQVHGVMPVSRGVRLAAVTWMQCAVREPHLRTLLYQLKNVQLAVEKRDPQSAENLDLLQVYSNLIRLWASF
jgi:PKHD-type hydroxylase